MRPGASERNLTPTSTAELSVVSAARPGTVPGGQMLHGHPWLPLPTVIVMPAPGVSSLPLSSAARVRMFRVPDEPAENVYVHVPRPLAGCHVVPPSVETSTPPTTPPPVSLAVPVTVTWLPGATVLFAAGAVIAEVGAVASDDGVAPVRSLCNVAGCAFMSASRFAVACCRRG